MVVPEHEHRSVQTELRGTTVITMPLATYGPPCMLLLDTRVVVPHGQSGRQADRQREHRAN